MKLKKFRTHQKLIIYSVNDILKRLRFKLRLRFRLKLRLRFKLKFSLGLRLSLRQGCPINKAMTYF
jgi:hypothetical protein